jgi:hypothetical protein
MASDKMIKNRTAVHRFLEERIIFSSSALAKNDIGLIFITNSISFFNPNYNPLVTGALGG